MLLVSGRVSVPKPLSQIQRSTRWLLQGLSPRTSFGGFGLRLLKTLEELGFTTDDRITFTALFTAEAVTLRFLPTDLGDVKTLFTNGITGGPALRHGHGAAYDTDRNTLWVTDNELDNDIFEFDVTTADGSTVAPLTRLDVPVGKDEKGNLSIQDIGFDPEDNTLFYTDGGTTWHIQRDGTLLGSFEAGGGGVAVQGDFVWVGNRKYDKVTGQFTGISVFIPTSGLAFDSDGNLLWGTHWEDGRFRAFDLDTGDFVFQSDVLVLPNGNGRVHDLAYGAGRLWVATETLESDVIYGIEVLDSLVAGG